MNPLMSLKKSCELKLAKAAKVGADKRTYDRKNKARLLLKKSLSKFEFFFPEAFLEEPKIEHFEKSWEDFIGELTSIVDNKADFIRVHNEIVKAFDNGTKQGLWHVVIPTHVHIIRREKPFKTKCWFERSCLLQDFEVMWLKRISKTNQIDELLNRCLYSAMFHSGLNEKMHVESLHSALQKQDVVLSKKGDLVWIDLYINPKDVMRGSKSFPFSTNDKVRDSEVLISRFYPTTMTLGFIYNYLKAKNGFEKTDNVTVNSFWEKLAEEIKSYDRTNKLLTPRQICDASIGICEVKPNVMCPEAILEYMNKRNMSYSLPTSNFLKIGEGTTAPDLNSLLNFKVVTNLHGSKAQSRQKPITTFGLISELRSILKPYHKNKKIKKNSYVIDGINNLKRQENNYSLHETIILDWLLNLLKLGRKPRTLKNYFSAIGALWITQSVNVNEEMSCDDFEILYRGMLETASTEKQRHYKKCRIIELHRFAVKHHNFPNLVTFKKGKGKGSIPHVRAAFVTESMFSELITAINTCDNAQSTEKNILTLIFIFAYRGGLRISEILKLRVSDFEYSSDGWLFIRGNIIDRDKSYASRRKIPLICLLTEEERAVLREYLISIDFINMKKQSPKKLLFSFSENSASPVEKFLVSNIASVALKSMTNLKLFVFHSLRHSAISKMQLIVHYNEFNLKKTLGSIKDEIIPYDDKQISLIVKMVCGINKGEKYWALSRFAGHINPQITFSSYFHFCDLITYASLNMNQQSFTSEQLSNVSGLSHRALNKISKNTEKTRICDIQSLLLSKLDRVKYCKTFFNTLKLAKTKYSPTLTRDSSRRFNHIYDLLVATEKGESVERLMSLYDINQNQLDSWVHKAKKINEITTSKKLSRNIPASRKNALIKPLPKAQADIDEIAFFRRNLRESLDALTPAQVYKKIYRMSKVVLKRSNANSSEILFRHYDTLKEFLDFMSYFPKNRWYIELNCSNEKDLKRWKQVAKGCRVNINKRFVQDSRNRNGQAKLCLLSKQQPEKCNENKWGKYSTSTIKFVVNIIAIAYLTTESLEGLIID